MNGEKYFCPPPHPSGICLERSRTELKINPSFKYLFEFKKLFNKRNQYKTKRKRGSVMLCTYVDDEIFIYFLIFNIYYIIY